MIESLEFQIAQSKIKRFEEDADEAIVRDSKLAQDCLDCEEFLERGMAALRWLERSEEALIEAVCEGFVEMSPDIEGAIQALFQSWQRTCQFAQKWIARCQENGFHVRNLAEFQACCQRAADWLERNEHYKLSKAAREERFAQEPW